MTIVLFETHATSLDNEAGLASGWFDVGLSAAGERQAEALGVRYARETPDVVYASDLGRALRTAEIAFGSRVPIVRDSRLRECDYGQLTQAPAADIHAMRQSMIDSPFPGGESYQDVVSRVARWLDDVLARHDGQTVLVIGHRATWYALEHLLRGAPLADVIAAEWRWQAGWRYTATGVAR